MKKGFAEEIFTFTVIIFSVILLTIFFASESVLKGGEVSRSVRGRNLDESANLALETLYDNKLERFQKTYLELIIDAYHQPVNETHVYYGEGLKAVHVREIINPLFNNYFGKGAWKLKLKTKKGSVSYGELNEDRSQYTYVSKFPVPEPSIKHNIGNVTLYV